MVKTNTWSSCFRIHDIVVGVTTDNRPVLDSIIRDLECFYEPSGPDEKDIVISFLGGETYGRKSFTAPENSKLIYSDLLNPGRDLDELGGRRLELYQCEDSSIYFLEQDEMCAFLYDLEEGRASGYLKQSEKFDPDFFSRLIFIIVFWELLRAKGYFPVHCSVVEKEGHGIVFPGVSGAGKTTASIALVREGFGFLGDDRPIFRYREDGVLEVLSFPEAIDVTDETIELFPELKDRDIFSSDRHGWKKSFNPEEFYPGCVRVSTVPKVILYPEISRGGETRVEKISKSEALIRFMPHSMVVTNKGTASRHFDVITDLIQTAECYVLKLGPDMDALKSVVESVL